MQTRIGAPRRVRGGAARPRAYEQPVGLTPRRVQMRAVQESPRCGARPGCPAALGDLRAFDPMPRPLPGSGAPRPVGGHLCRK